MNTKQYTAEDFAKASFARNPDGWIAARFDDDDAPWLADDEHWYSDATMAALGWVPVREAHENDGRVKRLKRHISDVEAVIKRRGEDIERLEAEKAELRERIARLKKDQPITLDSLRRVWETAEVADECNEGDVLIHRYSGSRRKVSVWEADRPERIGGYTRILHRAPKPKRSEGDERLDAMLRALVGDPALLADWLAERGVRVTEEGEK